MTRTTTAAITDVIQRLNDYPTRVEDCNPRSVVGRAYTAWQTAQAEHDRLTTQVRELRAQQRRLRRLMNTAGPESDFAQVAAAKPALDVLARVVFETNNRASLVGQQAASAKGDVVYFDSGRKIMVDIRRESSRQTPDAFARWLAEPVSSQHGTLDRLALLDRLLGPPATDTTARAA